MRSIVPEIAPSFAPNHRRTRVPLGRPSHDRTPRTRLTVLQNGDPPLNSPRGSLMHTQATRSTLLDWMLTQFSCAGWQPGQVGQSGPVCKRMTANSLV